MGTLVHPERPPWHTGAGLHDPRRDPGLATEARRSVTNTPLHAFFHQTCSRRVVRARKGSSSPIGKVRTALIPVAATVVLTALGCSDPEPNTPDTILGPVLDTPGHLATDTAKVARRLVKRLRGARVDGKSIFRNGRLIGVLTNSRVRPGRRGNSGAGGGEGHKHVPNPLAPPVGPQLETWCMVRIWYDLDTGEILDVEILYCWDDGSGGGGGGGGTNPPDPNDPTNEPAFILECDTGRERGSHVGCRVTVSDPHDEYDMETMNFQWSSTAGGSDSGHGRAEWGGTPTRSATITVTVTNSEGTEEFRDSGTIDISPRTDWRPDALNAPVSYTAVLPLNARGYYEPPRSAPFVPAPTRGDGPWDGDFMAGLPPQIFTTLWIHSDYTTWGPDYAGAGSTCTEASHLTKGSVFDVNSACSTWDAALTFGGVIETHERDHEDGLNACLSGHNGTATFEAMERTVGGDVSTVSNTMWNTWTTFWLDFELAGQWARPAFAPMRFWDHSSGIWVLSRPGIVDETMKQYGC